MGNIIKISMYAEFNCNKREILKLEKIDEAISRYNSWLKNNNRDDKMENYKEFLQAK
ncbi:hypothetical protein [Clostridium sp.]|uniref:hypothetical protein n=1 Tax=Clostridium sp. TaxID=1506 RepID=UPI00283F9D00|nr:hypothetical protein [Clostridium sp.]MDR3593278.1 hypothetical protein [Clostridium sp.]